MKIFEIVASDDACKKLLGESPTRFFPIVGEHGDKPYAIYQTITGEPFNKLCDRPDADRFTIQVDAYAKTYKQAKAVGNAIAFAIEKDCYITSWRGISQEPDTKLYRMSFDTNWIINR